MGRRYLIYSFLLDPAYLQQLIKITIRTAESRGEFTRRTLQIDFTQALLAGGVRFASVQWLSEALNPPGAGKAGEQNIFLQFWESPHRFVTSNCWCSFLLLAFPWPSRPQHQSRLLYKSRFLGHRKCLFPGATENFPKVKISFSDKCILRQSERTDIFLRRKIWIGISLIPLFRNPHKFLCSTGLSMFLL